MALQFVSTRAGRGSAPMGSFRDILLEGLAPDGGLAMPQSIPKIDAQELGRLSRLGYPELAADITARFADDLGHARLLSLCKRAYTPAKFGSAAITPLSMLGVEDRAPIGLLELSNGPTLAFKDIAMQLLGELFESVLAERGEKLNILGATSGDTGSAAEYAMRDKPSIAVFMLSPQGRMSEFQRAQMYSLQEANIHNLAVDGVFDDCQDMVKAVSADLPFKAQWHIGTVNSINFARIMAQIVYYFSGYFSAVKSYGLAIGDPVSFSVPSGNFGNVFSGFMARQMGLPVSRLVVATNENDVLDEFFKTGVYRVRRSAETFQTSSPSMDISKASNFERFIYSVLGEDGARCASLWQTLSQTGAFGLDDDRDRERVRTTHLCSGKSTHENRLQTIRDLFSRYQRVIDPHTADGVYVGRHYLEPGVPMICLETALPAKFGQTIVEALGRPAPRPAGLADIEARPQRVENMSTDVSLLKEKIRASGLK